MRDIVAAHPFLTEELPLIHTSRCDFLPEIVATHTLTPMPCPIFAESLVYLFYGRPAYRSTQGTKAGEPIPLCPICFVFKPRTVSRNIHRVFPCDTGAVFNDRFTPEITAMDLPELELTPSIDSAQRAVSLLFARARDYFLGRPVLGKAFPGSDVASRFYALLQRTGPVDYDDRKSAIEVQTNQIVDLKDQLLFVVLPKEFLEDSAIRDAIINSWNCDPIPYPTFLGDSPAAYYSVVRQKVAERFEEATRI